MILLGAMFEALAAVPLEIVARIDEHRVHVARLATTTGELRKTATRARGDSDRIDDTWVHYDLKLQEVELVLDRARSSGFRNDAVLRAEIVAFLNDESLLEALDRASNPLAQDADFAQNRALFLAVYAGERGRLQTLEALLRTRSRTRRLPDRSIGPAALRDDVVVERGLWERWSLISAAARRVRDQTLLAADESRDSLENERGKPVFIASIDP